MKYIPTEKIETITVEEAARILGISRNTAYAHVKNSFIPSVRLGRRIVIPRAAFDRFLLCQKQLDEDIEKKAQIALEKITEGTILLMRLLREKTK